MLEGFKCLIKLSLAVLNHSYYIYQNPLSASRQYKHDSSFSRLPQGHSSPNTSSSGRQQEEGDVVGKTNIESFIEILKHFSEELRVESHYLLTQAQNFKVTGRLMRDIEKLYVKEQRMTGGTQTCRGPGKLEESEYVDVGAEMVEEERQKAWRSSSLKNRMLMIAPNKFNKPEWIVLPQLPSKVE